MTDPLFLSIGALGAAYRSGALSPVAVTSQALDRIAACDKALNAFIAVLAERAMDRAKAAEAELRAGKDRGPLHGVPVGIKDLVEMAGVPTTFSSRAGSPRQGRADAAVIRHLEAAGAIVIGKTNLLEYAYGAVHPDFGQTNNPWNPALTSGGSSGGSAAAVAAGMCYAALGTDTGGSIRIPASYCGCVGLKPTYGLVPLDGVQALSWSLDHAGPLARSCADAALFLEGLTGRPHPVAAPKLQGMRLGVMQHEGAEKWLQPEVVARFEEAVKILEKAGAGIETVSIPDLALASDAVLAMIGPEASIVHQALIAREPEKFGPITRMQIEAGFAIPATAYARAQLLQQELKRRFAALFDRIDAILSPAVPWVAPAEDPPLNDDSGPGEMLYSGLYNLTGLPALVLPMGIAGQGLPAGLQIVTPWGADDLAFSIGTVLERAVGPLRPDLARLSR
ncbi:MAG TPA: amidase [Dongiaceae bacterium]|nr:amidase [Dongiaceae bacterium]